MRRSACATADFNLEGAVWQGTRAASGGRREQPWPAASEETGPQHSSHKGLSSANNKNELGSGFFLQSLQIKTRSS